MIDEWKNKSKQASLNRNMRPDFMAYMGGLRSFGVSIKRMVNVIEFFYLLFVWCLFEARPEDEEATITTSLGTEVGTRLVPKDWIAIEKVKKRKQESRWIFVGYASYYLLCVYIYT